MSNLRQSNTACGNESQEMYLATIYKVYKKRGCAYLSVVAEERGCSKPSVLRGLKTLEEKEYIIYDNGKIMLTKSGLEKAKDIEEKHNTLAAAFELLGVEKAEAEENACRMEHVISDNVHKRLYAFVKDKQGETPSVEKQGECFDLLLEYFTLSGIEKSKAVELATNITKGISTSEFQRIEPKLATVIKILKAFEK